MNYFTDNLWSDDKLPPYECNDYPYEHKEPYLRLSEDYFLSIQRYGNEVPWFAYEQNHLHLRWYEIDMNNERLCYYCAHDINKIPDMSGHLIYCLKDCWQVSGYYILSQLQDLDMWCHRCYTTSLFYISEWPWQTTHLLNTPVTEFIHRINA